MLQMLRLLFHFYLLGTLFKRSPIDSNFVIYILFLIFENITNYQPFTTFLRIEGCSLFKTKMVFHYNFSRIKQFNRKMHIEIHDPDLFMLNITFRNFFIELLVYRKRFVLYQKNFYR